MLKNKTGFTIIEVVTIVVVIAILATLGTFSLARIQAESRDSQREAKVAIISEALEKFYDKNGEYPSCSSITQDGNDVSQTTLEGIDPSVLLAPGDSESSNSITCATSGSDPTPSTFAYIGDGSSTCTTGDSCLEWTIKYRKEVSGEVKSVESRHKTSIATSGSITLTANASGFSKANLSWTEVSNATGYKLQRATNSSFSANLVEKTVTGTSEAVTGLAAGTTYYFRVQAQASSGNSNWSATKNVTTAELTSVELSAEANSNSQITATWSAAPLATSYTLQYSTSSSFSSPTVISGLTGTSRVITGLATGVTYYLRVQAIAPGDTSAWSNTASATTNVPAPTCSSSVLNSNTQITVSWGAVSVADSYTLQYATNSSFSGAGTLSGLTSTSRAVTGLQNATTYYFRVQALNGSTPSTWMNCPSVKTGISGPSSRSYSSAGCCTIYQGSTGWFVGNQTTSSTSYYSARVHTNGTCSGGATFQVTMDAWYAYSNNTVINGKKTTGWTNGNRWWLFINGNNSWYVFFQAHARCAKNGMASGSVNMGRIGGY